MEKKMQDLQSFLKGDVKNKSDSELMKVKEGEGD